MSTTLNITLPLSTEWPATIFAPNSRESNRLQISTYFAVGTLSVLIWDMLYNLRHDYDLAKTHKGSLTSIIYFLSRFSTLAFILLQVCALTVPISRCNSFHAAVLAFYNVLISTTMLLSYFRVCAVWKKNPIIIGFFGFLWLCGVGGSLTSITGIKYATFPGNPYCQIFVDGDYVAAAVFGPTANHVLVFIAITYGVCNSRANLQESLFSSGGYRVFIFGDTLPAFSKAILQSSQLCYLVAMLTGLVAMIWFFVYSSDPGFRLAIFPPYAALVNIIFSWVFRKAKLDLFTVIPVNNHNHSNGSIMGFRRPASSTFKLGTPSKKHSHDLEQGQNKSYTSMEYELATDPDAKRVDDQVKIGVEQIVEFRRDLGGVDKVKSSWKL